jgi:hypothetical protein
MIWTYCVIAWFVIGLLAVAWCLYTEFNPTEDFTLQDLGMVLATICLGPIFAIWYIIEITPNVVLIKGRVRDERGRAN